MTAILTTFGDMDPDMEKRLTRAALRAERSKQDRDAEIVVAFLHGAGIREIARAVKMSHPAVKYILDKNAEDPSIVEELQRREEKREQNRRLNRQRTADRT